MSYVSEELHSGLPCASVYGGGGGGFHSTAMAVGLPVLIVCRAPMTALPFESITSNWTLMFGGSRTTMSTLLSTIWFWWFASTLNPPVSGVICRRKGTSMIPVSTWMMVQAALVNARSMLTAEKCVTVVS